LNEKHGGYYTSLPRTLLSHFGVVILGRLPKSYPCPITQKSIDDRLPIRLQARSFGSMNGRHTSGISLSTHFEHDFLAKSIKYYLATIKDGEIGKV
jgi:hypothetical protein